MPQYFTYKSQVPLQAGQTLAFAAGKGYYAAGSAKTVAAGIERGGGSATAPAGKNTITQPIKAIVPIATLPDGTPPAGGAPPTNVILPGLTKDQTDAIKQQQQNQGGNSGSGSSSGSGDSGAGSGSSSTLAPTDWAKMFWGGLGLDDATISGLTKALTGVTDATQAQLLGEQYLRQSSWYQQTFPGFDLGVRAGLFTDETGYRSYVDALNQSSQQYLGRAVTSSEVTQALQGGVDPALYGNRLQGAAYAQTLGPEAQYQAGAFTPQGRLSDQELGAYGNEKAGIDTPLGQAITLRLQQAAQRMQGLFSGSLATPNLSLGPQGLFSPSLQGNKASPDVGA